MSWQDGINQLFQDKKKPILDGCGPDKKKDDMILDSAAAYADANLRLNVAATLQQWPESCEYIEDGESCADLLQAMMIGIADANKDGEITEDEQDFIVNALDIAWDYLSNKGASDEDIGALLNDWDEDAAQRIVDLLTAELPDGEDADSDMDDFAFEDQGSIFDAAYKKAIVVRNGKKVRINKRISGKVQISAKQKVAIRKAQLKSHGAGAMMRRAKSMRVRKQSGL